MDSVHVPVLAAEVLRLLGVRPGATVIDATLDGGGHAAAALEQIGPSGRILGIDRDPLLVARARERFAAEIGAGRMVVVHASFRDLAGVAREHGFVPADAILFDLGLSSFHLDHAGRGFAFSRDEPLDLRFDPTEAGTEPAADILARRDEAQLGEYFRAYGEERFASRIARAIARAEEPVRTSGQLFEVVRASIPGRERQHAGRSAARIFQALRIAANDELGAVRTALPQAIDLLAAGGRLAVISFHSLEDRIVKQLFAAAQRDEIVTVPTKRPVRASDDEVVANPRAASAKLRVAERTNEAEAPLAGAWRVLRYWMGEDYSLAGCEERQRLWFRASAATDNYIRERFGDLLAKALRGALDSWVRTPRGRFALIVVLDQFSRNVHRGTLQAFAGDAAALRHCLEGIGRGEDRELHPMERAVFALPMEHSEQLEIQEESVRYYARLATRVEPELQPLFAGFLDYARQHRDIIARFGRFPHRNETLGRPSTSEELEFLRQPGARF